MSKQDEISLEKDGKITVNGEGTGSTWSVRNGQYEMRDGQGVLRLAYLTQEIFRSKVLEFHKKCGEFAETALTINQPSFEETDADSGHILPKFRLLEWSGNDNHYAEVFGLHWYVYNSHDFWVARGPTGQLVNELGGYKFETEEQAKAAAQADFEGRMLAVMEPPAEKDTVKLAVTKIQGTDLLQLYIMNYIDGAQGCDMDWDAAQSLAIAIQDELAKNSRLDKRVTELEEEIKDFERDSAFPLP